MLYWKQNAIVITLFSILPVALASQIASVPAPLKLGIQGSDVLFILLGCYFIYHGKALAGVLCACFPLWGTIILALLAEQPPINPRYRDIRVPIHYVADLFDEKLSVAIFMVMYAGLMFSFINFDKAVPKSELEKIIEAILDKLGTPFEIARELLALDIASLSRDISFLRRFQDSSFSFIAFWANMLLHYCGAAGWNSQLRYFMGDKTAFIFLSVMAMRAYWLSCAGRKTPAFFYRNCRAIFAIADLYP